MKRYDKYKPSGVEWIGEIPEHWELKKLKWFFRFSRGFDLPSAQFVPGEYPVYGSNGIIGYHSESKAKGPGIIVGRSGSVGEVNYVESDFWPHNTCLYIQENSCNDWKYLFYYLKSTDLASLSSGTAVGTLNRNYIHDELVAFPSKTDQVTIAKYLDHKTAEIDDLIAKKQHFINLLNEEKTAIINHAVTRGLNPDVPMKDSGMPWLGKIPAHWEIKKLKYVANSVETGTTPPSGSAEYYLPEIDWFTPSDFGNELVLSDSKRKISNWAIEQGAARLFPGNSVFLVGIGATLGKVGLVLKPASSNQQINAISFGDDLSARYYSFFLLINQKNTVSLSNSATLAILNQTQTKDIKVLAPDRAEMEIIVRYIEGHLTEVGNTARRVEQEVKLLQEYRTALISEAVTGKIDVRGAN